MRSSLRRLLPVLALVCAPAAAEAQRINVRTIKDAPLEVPRLWVDIDWFFLDFGFNNIDGASLLMIGASGRMEGVAPRMAAEGHARMGIASFGDSKPIHLQGGIEYELRRDVGPDSVPVILGMSSGFNSEGADVTITRFVNVAASSRKSLGARAGAFFLTNSYSKVGTSNASGGDMATATNLGLYAGIAHTTSTHLIVTLNGSDPHPTARHVKFYGDVLLQPAASVDDALLEATASTGLIGFRGGWMLRPNLTTAEAGKYRTTMVRDFFRASTMSGEMGSRAIDGFYITAGISYSWIRR